MSNNLIELAERLNILLENDVIRTTANLVAFAHGDDLKMQEEEVSREQEVEDFQKVEGITDEQKEELLDELESIDETVSDLLEINSKLLKVEDLLLANGYVDSYNRAKDQLKLSRQVLEGLKEKEDRSLRAWNVDTERYEYLKFDDGDYDRLKNLNIVKKLYEKDGWIYKLYFFDKDLHLKPLDNYLLENEDYTMICLCHNGDILDLRKDNWSLVKHPLLRDEIVEEIDSAKKVANWLEEQGYTSEGDKLVQEIMETVEEIAKEKMELYEEAEEILKENGIDIEDDIDE